MNWNEITIHTLTAGIDILSDKLGDIGITGLIIEDKADFEDFVEKKQVYWDYIDSAVFDSQTDESRIKFYLADNSQGREQLLAVQKLLEKLKTADAPGEYGRLALDEKMTRESDWENNWKQYFKPFAVGERFLIKPSWEQIEDTGDKIVLEIDPASSFGTGTHETTQMCIKALEAVAKQGDTMLDLGCGSGILSIAGGLLGVSAITAVDIDLNAVNITRENLSKNGFASNVKAVCADILKSKQTRQELSQTRFDIVCANIVADVIIALAPHFRSFMKDGATLIVSGIIGERADEVANALLAHGFAIAEAMRQNDWQAFVLK